MIQEVNGFIRWIIIFLPVAMIGCGGMQGKIKAEVPNIYIESVIDKNLVAYWNFDEGEGNTLHDLSENRNNGTIYGAKWVNGRYGKGLKFDGVNDYVEIPANSKLSFDASIQSYTIEMWFNIAKFTNSRGDLHLIKDRQPGTNQSQSYGIGAILSSEKNYKKLSANIWYKPTNTNYAVVSDYALLSDEWYYVANVIKANQRHEIYINGKLQGFTSIEGVGNTKGNNGGITIGSGYYPSGMQHFNGIIDEVRIYNRVLSPEEIREHYRRGCH